MNEIDEIHPSDVPDRPKHGYWNRIGGGALTFAIIFHVILGIIGTFWIFQIIPNPEKRVDFLPGNGGAGGGERSIQTMVRQKKQAQVTSPNKVKRVFAEGATSSYTIPDIGDDFGEMSKLGSLTGGGMSGGLGGAGSGKGFGTGKGNGLGTGGLAIKPVMMFGIELMNTKKVAVVMDVSRSMTKYLPIVATELDKVSDRGPLILYFGCGLSTPLKNQRLEDDVKPANGRAFDRFWQITQGKIPLKSVRADYEGQKFDPDAKMPLPALYKQMSSRSNTYFLDFNGIMFAQPALLSKELRDADTIYWFSDFMDKVDDDQMKDVLRKLKSRKQKLFMHASVEGRFFKTVRDGLAIPSGGSAIIAEVK